MRWFVALAAAGGVAILSTCDPAVSSIYPFCPFHWLTGLCCPVCGSLRGLHALLHGHPIEAVRCNALAVAAVSYGIGALVTRMRRMVPPLPAQPAPRWQVAAACAVVVAFTVVRNMGFGWPLRP